MGFVNRPLSDLARLNSSEVAIFVTGKHAFERGEPFDPSMGDLWTWGWLFGAEDRRLKTEALSCR